LGRHRRDLVFRAYDRDLGSDRLRQRAGSDLGTNPPWIAQRNGESRS
jgi:hypothetical protein